MSRKVLFEGCRTRDFFTKVRNAFLRKMLYASSAKHLLTKPQPLTFAFDYISNEIAIDGIYEIDDLDILFEWLASMDSTIFTDECIDVGANIGNHSLYFSQYFSHVFSFEPNPRTFKVLSLNAELVSNIDCFDFGLSSSTGEAVLSCTNSNIGGSRVVEFESASTVPIKITTLDSFFNLFKNIRLIKYDVEGLEYEAILGSKKVIEATNPIVLFEQHKEDFVNGESKVISLLRSLGYTKFATIKKKSALSRVHFMGVILRIINGNSRAIVLENEFKPDFYPFIIAIPNWVK